MSCTVNSENHCYVLQVFVLLILNSVRDEARKLCALIKIKLEKCESSF